MEEKQNRKVFNGIYMDVLKGTVTAVSKDPEPGP